MSKRAICLLCVLWLWSTAGVALGELVGHWQLDEGSGTIARDSSGNGHDGTMQGTPQWGPGPSGQATGLALRFGASTCTAIDCGTFDPTDGTGRFTITFWAFWDGTGTFQHFFTKSDAWGTDTMMFQIELWGAHTDARYTDRVGISYSGPGSIPFSLMPRNEWVHFAWTFDGTVVALFKDGIPDEVAPQSFQLGPAVDAQVLIGNSDTGTRIFHGLLDDLRIYSQVLSEAEIQKTMSGIPPGAASDPNPADKAMDVSHDVILSWAPGEFAPAFNGHTVYFGSDFSDVNDGIGGIQQSASSYNPGQLNFDMTYYWRVDEVNQAPDSTIFKGNVWSFTTEPYGYPVQPVKATASSYQPGMGPEKTIDGSGLDNSGRHGTEATTMWLSAGVLPDWIQYEFDQVYKLHDLTVWNSNQIVEAFLGFSAKEVTIETSTDGTTWTPVADVPEFSRAPGAQGYAANTTVSLGDVEAKYVKLTINANWGGVAPQTGLAEVRFTSVPVRAWQPQPATAATDVSLDATLNWRTGREATSHQVYFGTDSSAVGAGTAAAETVTEHSYLPTSLNFGTTYYWKVDEVGAVTYPGDVWSFTTQEYRAIDDFESYTDQAGEEIFSTWIDGFTNGLSGSTVGYFTATGGTFGERTIVHGGRQSMPLQYDNATAPFLSEAERTFATAQNWTANGADTLVVYFRGLDPASATQPQGNSAEGLYLSVTDTSGKTGVVQHPDPAATNATSWQAWTIPLTEFTSAGVKMTAVKSLTIGVGNQAAPKAGGSGTVYVDDIGYGKAVK